MNILKKILPLLGLALNPEPIPNEIDFIEPLIKLPIFRGKNPYRWKKRKKKGKRTHDLKMIAKRKNRVRKKRRSLKA